MLFLIFVAILVVGFGLWIWSCKHYSQITDGLSVLFIIIGVLSVSISFFVMVANHTGINGYTAQMNERRESLVYQYEHNIYNDNDLGKRELMVDIQEWNEDLASNKANQRDFWIGIYIPNIYDQFEFIDLEVTDVSAET
jgi:hypothetical protein